MENHAHPEFQQVKVDEITYPEINNFPKLVSASLILAKELASPIVFTSPNLIHLDLWICTREDDVTPMDSITYPPNLESLKVGFRGHYLRIGSFPSSIKSLKLDFGFDINESLPRVENV